MIIAVASRAPESVSHFRLGGQQAVAVCDSFPDRLSRREMKAQCSGGLPRA